MAGSGLVSNGLSNDCLWILLHALISVSWTLYFRDLGDLSMVNDGKILQWKSHLSAAFTAWVHHLEAKSLSLMPEDFDWIGPCFAHLGEKLVYAKEMSVTHPIRPNLTVHRHRTSPHLCRSIQ